MAIPLSPSASTQGRVLGVDPGLRVTGYAVIEARNRSPHVCEAGILSTTEGRSPADMAKRLRILYDGMIEVIDQFRPERMAVEQLFSHYKHPRTAIIMGHARGVILLAAAQRNLTVTSFTPGRVKKTITGSGRASKSQVQHAIRRELGLTALPEPADVADALAVALCHYYLNQQPRGAK